MRCGAIANMEIQFRNISFYTHELLVFISMFCANLFFNHPPNAVAMLENQVAKSELIQRM